MVVGFSSMVSHSLGLGVRLAEADEVFVVAGLSSPIETDMLSTAADISIGKRSEYRQSRQVYRNIIGLSTGRTHNSLQNIIGLSGDRAHNSLQNIIGLSADRAHNSLQNIIGLSGDRAHNSLQNIIGLSADRAHNSLQNIIGLSADRAHNSLQNIIVLSTDRAHNSLQNIIGLSGDRAHNSLQNIIVLSTDRAHNSLQNIIGLSTGRADKSTEHYSCVFLLSVNVLDWHTDSALRPVVEFSLTSSWVTVDWRFICLFKSFVPLQCVVVGLTFKPLCEAVEKFAHCRAGVFTEQTFHMSLIVLLLLISCFTPAEPVCSPVREGQPTTLSCNVNPASCSSDNFLIWRADNVRAAQCLRSLLCGVKKDFSATATLSSAGSSTLTINSVSRTDPFNMEVKWTCLSCGVDPITACEKLEVYAPPESPSCTVREDTESGDIKSVTVSCSTSKVYPKARCRFYRTKDGGHSVEITNPVYSHTETGETPVYYRSQCSVSVSVQELGEGTHSFTGYIYPGVTGDPAKVTGTPADKTVTLSFSQASHSCRPEAVQGYFLEESTTCTCSLSSDGHPRGTAQWYKGGQLVGSGGTLVVSRDRSNPESVQTYTCEAVSDLGQKLGTTLTAKFACRRNEICKKAGLKQKLELSGEQILTEREELGMSWSQGRKHRRLSKGLEVQIQSEHYITEIGEAQVADRIPGHIRISYLLYSGEACLPSLVSRDIKTNQNQH
ncbi:hypothetical protein RRG08_061709 [Elysia crispata]|uniref:Ig-like domain-containing protein n=1 Tax=Elysia crispata TaxID=231223 RepID=A0AAE0Y9E4_9GAST|nr:hypothetical protein RRG08_061709 [Elysia crispata]